MLFCDIVLMIYSFQMSKKTTAEVNNQTVYSECIKYYVGSMESSLKAVSYLKETDFQKAHNDAKRGALAQVWN